MGFKRLNSSETVESGDTQRRLCAKQSEDFLLLKAAGRNIDSQQMRVDIDSVLDQSILIRSISY